MSPVRLGRSFRRLWSVFLGASVCCHFLYSITQHSRNELSLLLQFHTPLTHHVIFSFRVFHTSKFIFFSLSLKCKAAFKSLLCLTQRYYTALTWCVLSSFTVLHSTHILSCLFSYSIAHHSHTKFSFLLQYFTPLNSYLFSFI